MRTARIPDSTPTSASGASSGAADGSRRWTTAKVIAAEQHRAGGAEPAEQPPQQQPAEQQLLGDRREHHHGHRPEDPGRGARVLDRGDDLLLGLAAGDRLDHRHHAEGHDLEQHAGGQPRPVGRCGR